MLFSKEELRRLIVPLMIEQILAVTIGMADTMMVANVGEAAVSGVSLVDSINILLINIFSAMATGGAVVASQYIGRQDRQNACSAAKQLIYSSAFIALLLGLLALVGGEHLLRLVFGSVDADGNGLCGDVFLALGAVLSLLGRLQCGRGAVPLHVEFLHLDEDLDPDEHHQHRRQRAADLRL